MRAQIKISRRQALAAAGSASILRGAQRPQRPRIAAIATTYFKYSHAQHIVDRFLEGYGWNGTQVANGELPNLVKNPAAYFIEHNDGLRTTLLMLNGAVKDYNFAARLRDRGLKSCQFLLTPTPNVTYSACLVDKIEQTFATGRAPYPVERTLIVSGILESCLESSKVQGGKRLETPHLNVRYRAPEESHHARS